MGHGRALINVENDEVQSELYHKIISQNLSVRETETLVKNYQDSLKPKPVSKKTTSFEVPEEDYKALSSYFGSKIELKVGGNGKGKIAIPFHSQEDFQRIIKLIKP
jgi:ParB family chromosome partitioning protein